MQAKEVADKGHQEQQDLTQQYSTSTFGVQILDFWNSFAQLKERAEQQKNEQEHLTQHANQALADAILKSVSPVHRRN